MTSIVSTVVCLGLGLWWGLFALQMGRGAPWWGLLPLLLLAGCVPFVIRGYTVTGEALLVQRLFWCTRISLTELQAADVQPRAMRGSLRLWGNGGLLSITGWYWNRALGSYRAYVTDVVGTVVLRFPKRTLVVSPGAPEEFAQLLAPLCRRP